MKTLKSKLVLAALSLATLAAAQVVQAQPPTSEADTTPYAAVLARALQNAGNPDIRFLRLCGAGWSVGSNMNQVNDNSEGVVPDFIAAQFQIACVVSHAEQAILGSVAGKTFTSAEAQQAAADAAARKLRFYYYCPANAQRIEYLDGPQVQATFNQPGPDYKGVEYSCGPRSVTLSRNGKPFFTWSPPAKDVIAMTQTHQQIAAMAACDRRFIPKPVYPPTMQYLQHVAAMRPKYEACMKAATGVQP